MRIARLYHELSYIVFFRVDSCFYNVSCYVNYKERKRRIGNWQRSNVVVTFDFEHQNHYFFMCSLVEYRSTANKHRNSITQFTATFSVMLLKGFSSLLLDCIWLSGHSYSSCRKTMMQVAGSVVWLVKEIEMKCSPFLGSLYKEEVRFICFLQIITHIRLF